MSNLDDVSLSIGAIQAEQENARRSREVTHQKLENISRQMEEMSQLLAGVVRDIGSMRPEVEHYSDTRRRVAGGWALFTVVAGAVGAFIIDVVKGMLIR